MEDQELTKEQLIPESTLSSSIDAKRKETMKNLKTPEEELRAAASPKIPDCDVYPLILDQLKAFLEQKGYQELSPPDGRSALGSTVVDQTEIKDEYQVWHLSKSDPKSSMIPVLLIKALEEDIGQIEGFKAGYFEKFSDPLQRLELVSRQKAYPILQGLQMLLYKQKIKL